MLFKYFKDSSVTLQIYHAPSKKVPVSEGDINIFCDKVVSIHTGSKNTGVWTVVDDNKMVYTVDVHLHRPLNISSKAATWFFDLMRWFNVITGEHHLVLGSKNHFMMARLIFHRNLYKQPVTFSR